MNISEIRERYPQYQDMTDDQLAQGLHDKYYNDMPFEEFSQRIGLKASHPFGGITSISQGKPHHTLIERGVEALNNVAESLGLHPAKTAQEKGRSSAAKAQDLIRLMAKEKGIPVSKFRESPELLEQAAQGFTSGFTGGLLPALVETYTGEKPWKPSTTGGEITKGIGELGGMVAGLPAAAGQLVAAPILGTFSKLTPEITERVIPRVGKAIISEAINLAPMFGATALGDALQHESVGEAAKTVGEATKSGALTGVVFGATKGLFPADVQQRAARVITGLVGLNVQRAVEDPEHKGPWKKPLAKVVKDTVMDVFFLWKGLGPKAFDNIEKSTEGAANADQIIEGIQDKYHKGDLNRNDLDNIIADMPENHPLTTKLKTFIDTLNPESAAKDILLDEHEKDTTAKEILTGEKQPATTPESPVEPLDEIPKSAKTSAEVFIPYLDKAERKEAVDRIKSAVEKLTQDSGKSAKQSANDMLVAQELLNNRIYREETRKAEQHRRNNPELAKIVDQAIDGVKRGKTKAESAITEYKIDEIKKLESHEAAVGNVFLSPKDNQNMINLEIQKLKKIRSQKIKEETKQKGTELTAAEINQIEDESFNEWKKKATKKNYTGKFSDALAGGKEEEAFKLWALKAIKESYDEKEYKKTTPSEAAGATISTKGILTDVPGVNKLKVEESVGDKLKNETTPKPEKSTRHSLTSSPSMENITIEDVQKSFPGQSVIKKENGSFEVKTKAGPRISVKSVDKISNDEINFQLSHGEEQVAGSYEPETHTIRIVKGVGDRWTLHHESYHFLETSGMIGKKDIRVLDNAIFLEKTIHAKEEDRAIFVETALKNRSLERHSGPVKRVLQKIGDLVDSFVNLFHRTSRNIIRDIETGKAFERDPAFDNAASGTRYSKKEVEDHVKWARQIIKEHLASSPDVTEAEEKIKAAASSDESIHKEALGLFKYAKNRFGKGFKDDDMKWHERAFEMPYWLGKKYKSMATAVNIEIAAAEKRSTELFKDYNGDLGRIQETIPKNKKQFKELKDLIWQWDGRRFPKSEVPTDWHKELEKGKDIEINPGHYAEIKTFLEKKSISPEAIDAFLTIRKKLDEKLVDIDRTLRVEKMDPTDIEEYRSQINTVHNYFPHRRTGNSHVTIIDKDTGETVYREHYSSLQDRALPVSKKAWARAGSWLEDALESKKLKGEKSGYKIIQGPVKLMPDEAFFQVPVQGMQQIANEAGKRLEAARAGYEADRLYNKEGRTKKEALEIAKKRMSADMSRALSKAVAEVFKGRGWAGHAIGRKGVPGHEKSDVFGILFDYLSGYAGFKTKISRAKAHHENLVEIEAKKHPNEYRHLSKYVKDMLANQDNVDRAVDSLRGLFFVKYLGYVPKSGLVNLTQNIVMAAPILSQHTDGILKAERILGKAMVDVRKALTSKAAWTGKTIDYTRLSKNELSALHELVESGAAQDLFLRELKGNMPGIGWGKYFKKVVDKAGIFMMVAEKFNRAATGLAAYRIGIKEKGMSHDEAVNFAKEIIYDSHFLYGKANLPTAFRGGDFQKVARAAYTFRSFSHNYISAMAHLLKQGPTGQKAFARSLRNLFLMGGATAIPFFKAASEALLWVIGQDDEDALTKVREIVPGTWLKDLVVYGLPGAAGVDFTGSLSIEVPRSWKEIIGVPWAGVEDTINTIEDIRSGANFRALSETPFTPIAVRNAMRGFELYTYGQRTRSGKDVNYFGKEGPRKITAAEAVLKSLAGLQPVSMSKGYGAFKATKRMKESIQNKKSKFASRYVNAMIRLDDKGMKEVEAELEKWNKKAEKSGKYYKIIDITGAVNYRMRQNSSLIPKVMRQKAFEIAKEWGNSER